VVPYSKISAKHLSGETEKNYESLVRIATLRTEIEFGVYGKLSRMLTSIPGA
jgi:hypothetical protein